MTGERQTGTGRPTIRDVAAKAGVSTKTVSRVVNEEPGVSDQLTLRVTDAIEQLRYRHNLAASTLRRADGRTATVGVLLIDIGDPFFSSVNRAIQHVARARGVDVLVACSDEDPTLERMAIQAFARRHVDGLILAPTGADHRHLKRELEAGVPLVVFDRPASTDIDAVLSDNRVAAATAVAHLLRVGHRRIAYIGGDHDAVFPVQQRLAGYVDALTDAGVEVDKRLVRHCHTQRALEALLAQRDPPTALFTCTNHITLNAIRAIKAMGVQHSVAVLGFDDFPAADLMEPPVSVIAQDPAAIGARAAEVLFRRIDGDRSPASVHIIPTVLIPRGSGEILGPVRDPSVTVLSE
jgi:LacI family transcriptional regulator